MATCAKDSGKPPAKRRSDARGSVAHGDGWVCTSAKVAGTGSLPQAKRRKRTVQAMLRSTTQWCGTNTKPRLAEGKWQLHVLR